MTKAKSSLMDTVDILVVGASTGAVTAALAAREKGARVFVLSERPYFGDEAAGALELETRSADPLVCAIQGGGRISPGAYKHGLEKALLRHKIPFLFLARPIALLRDALRQPAGVVVAYRTALYAIAAKTIIDFSRGGLIAALTETPRVMPSPSGASLMVMAPPETELALGSAKSPPVGTPWEITHRNGKTHPLQAYRITDHLPATPASVAGLATLEHRFRSGVMHPDIVYSADTMLFTWQGHDTGADDPLTLPAEAYQLSPQLLHTQLPLSATGLGMLQQIDTQAALGRKLGAWAAATLPAGSLALKALGIHPSAIETDYRFDTPYPRQSLGLIEIDFPALPVLGSYDVLIAGGGTAGASAAIAAARAGARTAVLEIQRGLGGVGTMGTIASYWFGNKVGFTEEIDRSLATLDPTYGGTDKRSRWNPDLKMSWYHRALAEAGGEAWLGSYTFGVRMEGDRVNGLLVSTPYGCGLLTAEAVIDASGNADLAAAAGAPCRAIGAAHAAIQGAGLSPRHPGDHYVNTDFTFVEESDPVGITHAFTHARAKFNKQFDTIPFVNSRERRQIVGEMELSPLDLLAKRRFPDTINIAHSNFDTHGFTVHPVFSVVTSDHKPLDANIPLRCLMPQGVRGMLVTGLGMSAHRDALPVIRMQPDVQNQGYAAGVAAAMSVPLGGDFTRLSVRQLQEHLIEKGHFDREVLEWNDSFPLPEEAISRAAHHTPVDFVNAAIILAHPEQSLPILREILANPANACQREEVALMLGLMGCKSVAPVLLEIVASRGWDDGWNYRGMGQFGLSNSRMDALIMALATTGAPAGIPVIAEKITTLTADAAFSHCRAVAIAAAMLHAPELGRALHALLNLPTVQGHTITSTAAAVDTANDDPVETASRNLSLRELYLAKGLYLCGDPDGLGAALLQRYTQDLRGPYAAHATAILQSQDLESIRYTAQ